MPQGATRDSQRWSDEWFVVAIGAEILYIHFQGCGLKQLIAAVGEDFSRRKHRLLIEYFASFYNAGVPVALAKCPFSSQQADAFRSAVLHGHAEYDTVQGARSAADLYAGKCYAYIQLTVKR